MYYLPELCSEGQDRFHTVENKVLFIGGITLGTSITLPACILEKNIKIKLRIKKVHLSAYCSCSQLVAMYKIPSTRAH